MCKISISNKPNIIHFDRVFTITLISGILSLLIPENSYKNSVIESFMKDGYMMLFVFTCIFVPLIETFFYQYLPFLLVNLMFKHKKRFLCYIIIAPLVFGCMHNYNIFYSLTGCFVGFILCFFFYVAKLRKQNALILMAIIHSLNNFIALLCTI